MISLSSSENTIFDLMEKGDDVTLDDIHLATKAKSRHSAVIRMKYLAAKLAPEGWIISKVSGIGRGAKAVYNMKKRF